MKTCALTLTLLAVGGGLIEGEALAKPDASTEAVEAFARATTPWLNDFGTPSLALLEELYDSGTTEGGLPLGKAVGRAFFTGIPGLGELEEQLRVAGLPSVRTAEDLIANVVWRGKTFRPVQDAEGDRIGVLTNDVFGFDIATADIRQINESSDPDEANTIYLDYSRSNFPIVRGVQDYIRKVGDGQYVGKAFLKVPGTGKRVLACYFALDFGGSN